VALLVVFDELGHEEEDPGGLRVSLSVLKVKPQWGISYERDGAPDARERFVPRERDGVHGCGWQVSRII
jgi:hypothetical protein